MTKLYVQFDKETGNSHLVEESRVNDADPLFTFRLASLADLVNGGYDYRYKLPTTREFVEGVFTFKTAKVTHPERRCKKISVVSILAGNRGNKFLGSYTGTAGYKKITQLTQMGELLASEGKRSMAIAASFDNAAPNG